MAKLIQSSCRKALAMCAKYCMWYCRLVVAMRATVFSVMIYDCQYELLLPLFLALLLLLLVLSRLLPLWLRLLLLLTAYLSIDQGVMFR